MGEGPFEEDLAVGVAVEDGLLPDRRHHHQGEGVLEGSRQEEDLQVPLLQLYGRLALQQHPINFFISNHLIARSYSISFPCFNPRRAAFFLPPFFTGFEQGLGMDSIFIDI